jgi:hypothetical protein
LAAAASVPRDSHSSLNTAVWVAAASAVSSREPMAAKLTAAWVVPRLTQVAWEAVSLTAAWAVPRLTQVAWAVPRLTQVAWAVVRSTAAAWVEASVAAPEAGE